MYSRRNKFVNVLRAMYKQRFFCGKNFLSVPASNQEWTCTSWTDEDIMMRVLEETKTDFIVYAFKNNIYLLILSL
jgi:hypothetical protein